MKQEIKVPFKAYKGVVLKKINDVTILKATSSGNSTYVFQKENIINDDRPLSLCTNSGFHFSLKLGDAVTHVGKSPSMVYYEIEVLGDFLLGKDKGITKQFKFIRSISELEMDKIVMEEKINHVLSTVQKMQTAFPYTVLGGSLALYLYGARLERFKEKQPDIDLSVPFYHGFEELIDESTYTKTDPFLPVLSMVAKQSVKNKNYGNDFDYSLYVDDSDVDVKIDPLQKYQIIQHNGFNYKVALLPVILAAKAKYALNGNEKHNDDLLELISGTQPEKPVKDTDLPF